MPPLRRLLLVIGLALLLATIGVAFSAAGPAGAGSAPALHSPA